MGRTAEGLLANQNKSKYGGNEAVTHVRMVAFVVAFSQSMSIIDTFNNFGGLHNVSIKPCGGIYGGTLWL